VKRIIIVMTGADKGGILGFVRNLLRFGIIIFGMLSLLAFGISLSTARGLYVDAPRNADRTWHFSLYLPDNRNSFFTGIIAGAQQAAAEMNAALSVHSVSAEKNDLAMSSYTGIDGAVVCPFLDDASTRRQLEKLRGRQIPTVLINHNIPSDQPWPFIGANNFDVGRNFGIIAGNIRRGPVRPAIVYSDKAPGIYGERELVEMGITAALGDRLAEPITQFKTNLNPLDAEALMARLFRSRPAFSGNFTTLIFTDPNDTIAAVQTLIDMNLVGRVQVIGFGDDPGVLENIRKGIIACTVVINPERIGYEAVKALTNLRLTGYTSTSVDTGIELIDRQRLEDGEER
jgi:ribose transport system substrate-binding protein